MALARQSFPFVRMEFFSNAKVIRTALAAGILAVLCGAAAFLLLVLRDHGRRRVMVNDQARPALRPNSQPIANSSSAAATRSKDASTAPSLSAGTIPPGKTEFSASKGSGLVSVGPLKLSLTGTDTENNTYDLRVQAGRRAFSHRHIQIDQPLWISTGRAKGAIQLVVTRIEGDAVAGYWSEVARSARLNSSSRVKHR
jgi:hypothetical protein